MRSAGFVAKWTAALSGVVAGALAVAMMLVIGAGVFGRAVFGRNLIVGHEEIAGYLLAALVAFGLAASFASGSFVKVEIAYNKLPLMIQSVLLTVFTGILVIILAIMVYETYLLSMQSFNYGTRSIGSTEIMIWIPQSIFSIGLFVFFLHLIATMIQLFNRNSHETLNSAAEDDALNGEI